MPKGTPSRVTSGATIAIARGSDGDAVPSSIAGEVRPRPVAKMVSSSPWRTGFRSETISLLAALTIKADPAEALRNTLGAVGRILKFRLSLTPPGVRSIIWAFPSVVNGNCALICVLDARMSGMATPFTVRQDSAMEVGSGICRVAMLSMLRSLPVIVIKPPGATGLVLSAEFTTLVRCGVGTAASKLVGMTVIPDCDNEIAVPWLARTASVRENADLALNVV